MKTLSPDRAVRSETNTPDPLQRGCADVPRQYVQNTAVLPLRQAPGRFLPRTVQAPDILPAGHSYAGDRMAVLTSGDTRGANTKNTPDYCKR